MLKRRTADEKMNRSKNVDDEHVEEDRRSAEQRNVVNVSMEP